MSPRNLVFAIVAVAAMHRGAAAELVEARGIELDVPKEWSREEKKIATLFKPKAYRGRAIELIDLKKMPDGTVESFDKLMPEKMEIVKAKPITRFGVKMAVAEGKYPTKKEPVTIDMIAIPVGDRAVLVISFIAADQDPILRRANQDILKSARLPGPRLSIEYIPPAKATGAPKDYVEWITKVVGELDTEFRLPRAVPIRFKDCGTPNAFYSPRDHAITICHEYWDTRRKLFNDSGHALAQAEELTRGAMTFSFFHEFGHLLHFELGLPLTGKGEDAADEIAALWLIGKGEQGRRVAKHAATAHHVKSKQPGHKDIYWDEHSYSEQRVIAIACLLYGADKAGYTELMQELKVPKQRLAKCSRDYGLKLKAWGTLLKPHFRPKAKKPPVTPAPAPK